MINWPFSNNNVYKIPNEPLWKTTEEIVSDDEAPYTIGVTADNRVMLKMGNSKLTMNIIGVNEMIDQLTMYRDQLLKRAEQADEES